MQLKERQNLIFQKEKRVLFSTFAKKSLGLCTCVLIIHEKIIQPMSLVTLTVFRNVMVALGWTHICVCVFASILRVAFCFGLVCVCVYGCVGAGREGV